MEENRELLGNNNDQDMNLFSVVDINEICNEADKLVPDIYEIIRHNEICDVHLPQKILP